MSMYECSMPNDVLPRTYLCKELSPARAEGTIDQALILMPRHQKISYIPEQISG